MSESAAVARKGTDARSEATLLPPVAAEPNDGVPKLRIPKAAHLPPTRIEVGVGVGVG